jgi:hypothetical protein
MDAALAWAARGFRVFPLTRGDKIPPKDLLWKVEATTDPAKIRLWWAHDPQFNYGVAGGDGLLIVDVDRDGYATLLDFDLPETLTVKTPGGGMHLYLRGPDVQNSVRRLGAGIDIRSAGGYVVGPGSYFADPGARKGYRGGYHIVDDREPAEAPNQFVLMAGEPKAREQGGAISIDEPDDIVFAIHYLQKDAPIAIEGRGGNDTTYAVAARVVEIGVSADRAADIMAEHWNERCLPPWSKEELVGLCHNAEHYAQRRQGSGSVAMMASEGGDPADTLPPAPPGSGGVAEQLSKEARMSRLRASLTQAEPGFAHHKPVPCVVEHLAWRGEVTMLWGPGSAGKSLFAEAMLPAYAAAGKALGRFRIPKPVKTLVLNTEDTESETLSRAVACAGANGINEEIVSRALLVMARDNAVEFSVADYGPFKQLRVNDRGIDDLAAVARENETGLIVLDPLSNLHGLDDNSVADMSVVLKAMRRLACEADATVILLLHTNKAGLDSPGDPSAMGGSGKLTTGVRKTMSLFSARGGGKSGTPDPRNADGADAAGRFPAGLDKREARTWVRLDDAKANRGFSATTWLRVGVTELPVKNEFGEPVTVPVMTLAYDLDAVAPAQAEPAPDAAREFSALDEANYERYAPLFQQKDGSAADLALNAMSGLGVNVFRREAPASARGDGRGQKLDPGDLAEAMVATAAGWDLGEPDTPLKARACLEWLVRTGRAERRYTNPVGRNGRKMGAAISIRVKPDSQGDKGTTAAIVEAIRKGPPARENGSAPRGGSWLLDNGRSANSIHLELAREICTAGISGFSA